MSTLILKQDFTINKVDYQVIIFQDDETTHRVRCSKDLFTWEGVFTYYVKEIERLRLALQKQHSLKVVAEFSDGDHALKFVVTHPVYDTSDTFVLTKQLTNGTIENSLIVSRLEVVERLCERTYQIYKHMLGPAVTHIDIFNDIEQTRRYIEDYCTMKLTKANQTNQTNTDAKKDFNHRLIFILPEYYNIRRVYSKTRPVETENQIVINKTILVTLDDTYGSNHEYERNRVIDEQNVYTIFTKRHQDPEVIGYINIKKDYRKYMTNHPSQLHWDTWIVDIHLMYKYNVYMVSKKVETNSNCTKTIPFEDYLNNAYVLSLPSCINDGIYHIDGTIDNRYLVKDGKLYSNVCGDMINQDTIDIYDMPNARGDTQCSFGIMLHIEE